MSVIEVLQPEVVIRELLAWYADTQRDLPWRRGGGLYGIWISEIMLQQTTVATVIPYWERFLERFPTVFDLAEAPEAEVLSMWAGLGYYTRARHLHAAAQAITVEGGGAFPTTCQQWRALPGVGAYASGAIASIGLGERVPAVDANARRVLLRLAAKDPEALDSLTPRQLERDVAELAARLVPAEQPGAWNQGLMELGALVCGARQTDCGHCPLQKQCRAHGGRWVDQVPAPKPRAAATRVRLAQLLVVWRDRVFLAAPGADRLVGRPANTEVVRSDFDGLHRGLWGLPTTAWHADTPDLEWSVERWCDAVPQPDLWSGPPPQLRLVGQFRHSITRYRLRVDVYRLEWDAREIIPTAWCGDHKLTEAHSTTQLGLFFAASGKGMPISKLAEKALHFQHDTVD